jgi:hypothetical protein
MSSHACRHIKTSEKDSKRSKNVSKVLVSATYLDAACHKVSMHESNLKIGKNWYVSTKVP